MAPRSRHTATRSPTRAERSNPILLLPAISRLRELDPEVRACLRDLLLDLQRDARARATASWDAHKPPMAAYWAAVGVYSGHIARTLRDSAPRSGSEGVERESLGGQLRRAA